MPKVDLTVEEILVFNPDLPTDKIEVLIRDGLALARRAAPCIDEDSFMYPEAAAAIIRAAVLRWAESGGGAISSQTNVAGPFTQQQSWDTRQARRSLFFPSEVTELQRLCQTNKRAAFSVDTIPDPVMRPHPTPEGVLFGSLKGTGR